jgi:hypothetical protein
MGNEIRCSVRTAGKTAEGKALLEGNEVLFRGDIRLKIPLASLKSVISRDGELHVQWARGTAIFELGEQADKWAYKILHPKSVAEKLGVKPGLVTSAIAPEHPDFLRDLRNSTETFSDSRPLKDSDLIFFAATTISALRRVAKLKDSLSSNGALWIVYPKGRQEIKEVHVLEAGRAAGLVDVKVVSFSESHTALKFVRPKSKR